MLGAVRREHVGEGYSGCRLSAVLEDQVIRMPAGGSIPPQLPDVAGAAVAIEDMLGAVSREHVGEGVSGCRLSAGLEAQVIRMPAGGSIPPQLPDVSGAAVAVDDMLGTVSRAHVGEGDSGGRLSAGLVAEVVGMPAG